MTIDKQAADVIVAVVAILVLLNFFTLLMACGAIVPRPITGLRYEVTPVPVAHTQEYRQIFPLHVLFADFVATVTANEAMKSFHEQVKTDLARQQAMYAGREVDLYVRVIQMP